MLKENETSPPAASNFKPYIRDIRILTNSIKGDLELIKQSGIDTRFNMVQTDTGYDIHISLLYSA
jgi:hypothetical protein